MFDFVFENPSVFPWLETLHVFGFSLWVGSIFILDLKLLGLIKRAPYYHYHLVPWAYAGLGLALLTGFLFIGGNPDYLANPALQRKIALLLVAAILATFFHTRLVDAHIDTSRDSPTPLVAKLAGASSIVLWVGVLVLARMIPYQVV
jgi:hypothetical protein